MDRTSGKLPDMRRRLLASAALVATTSCALRTPVSDALAASTPAPMRLSAYGLVFTPVRLAGHESMALIDTGSASVVRVSAGLAKHLGLRLAVRAGATARGLDGQAFPVQTGRAALNVAGIELDSVDIEVTGERIESIAAQVGTAFDVLLGWGFLSRDDFTLDYPGRKLWIGEIASTVQATAIASTTVPYVLTRGLPVVDARVAGQDVKLLVDSGAPMCNLDTTFSQSQAGKIVARTLQLGTRTAEVQWRAKDLAVTRHALGTVGTIGNNLLSLHTVGFRIRASTMVLG